MHPLKASPHHTAKGEKTKGKKGRARGGEAHNHKMGVADLFIYLFFILKEGTIVNLWEKEGSKDRILGRTGRRLEGTVSILIFSMRESRGAERNRGKNQREKQRNWGRSSRV